MKKNHKNQKTYRCYRRPYPNAADPGYFLDKVVDGILSAVSSLGVITFFFFLVTM